MLALHASGSGNGPLSEILSQLFAGMGAKIAGCGNFDRHLPLGTKDALKQSLKF